jgi:hypothetical protein
MSARTHSTSTPAAAARFRARSSSVSDQSSPVTRHPARASATECRPHPQARSSTRASGGSGAISSSAATSRSVRSGVRKSR